MPNDSSSPRPEPDPEPILTVYGPQRRFSPRTALLSAAIAIPCLVLGAFVATAATGGGSSSKDTHTIRGAFDLNGKVGNDVSCSPTGGYSDIGPGTSVTVSSGSGEILGVGSLNSGTDKKVSSYSVGCTYNFVVYDVPDAPFYKVEVANRGALTFSKADMEANLWTVGASLGSRS